MPADADGTAADGTVRAPGAAAPAAAAPPAHLHRWRHPAILVAAWLSVASGFAQFGVATTLGDVARAFGHAEVGARSVTAQLGLSGTVLAGGLAIIRISSLASLPLASLADRLGRRRVLLGCAALGLAVTALAAASPSYWWFVALFALARPLLSATNAVATVVGAEETRSSDRAKAIALITAGYGLGAGLTAVIRGVAGDAIGWRGIFALVLLPLALIPLLGRWLEEPDRYRRLRHDPGTSPAVRAAPGAPADVARGMPARTPSPQRLRVVAAYVWPGRVRADLRGRLWLLCGLAFALSLVSGPANTLLFAYGENVLGMSRSTTALVVSANAFTGVAGLLAGRWAADRLGRRVTAGVTMALIAAAAILTYSGSVAGAVAGYLLAVLFGSAFAPALGALGTELFPTSTRATASGWVVAAGVLGAGGGLYLFGRLLDALNGFGAAMAVIAMPVVVASALFAWLPETRGKELEESAPEAEEAEEREVSRPGQAGN